MRRLPSLLAAAVVVGACTSGPTGGAIPARDSPPPSPTTPAVALDAPEDVRVAGVTSPAGVTAAGTVDLSAEPTRVEVGPAAWVLGVPTATGTRAWVTVAADGTSLLVEVGESGARVTPWPDWDPVRPPVLESVEGRWRWGDPAGAGPVAPVAVTEQGWWVAVDTAGDLRVRGPDGAVQVVPGPFLPDARAVPLPDGRLAVLAGPTDEYGHGVLGDAVEAGTVAIVDPTDATVAERLQPDDGRVVEGTAPLVGDVDGDGAADLVVTTSADADGARVEAWSLDDGRRLVGPAIGRGSRWRHQVAVAPAPGGGGNAVVEVVTPHLDRVVQWLVPGGGDLVAVGERVGGVASHQLGSRNLQQAAVVDVDGDGDRELVGPDRQGDALLVVDRDPEAGTSTLAYPLGAAITSNVALVGEGDTLAMAVVTADGILHVWG